MTQETKEVDKMLVLTRKRNEKIMIGDNITVTIVDIRDDKCKIGIDAPVETAVHRQEVWDKIRSDEQTANREGNLANDVG